VSTALRRFLGVATALAVVVGACGDDDDTAPAASSVPAEDPVTAAEARVSAAQSAVADTQAALDAAGEQFCGDAVAYVDTLDRYGKLFTDSTATVGDVQTLGADLVAPRDAVAAAADAVAPARDARAAAEQELVDAQAALAIAVATASSLPVPASTEPGTTTTTTLVPAATVDRVRQAEEELTATAAGITEATPLAEATAEYNSAAFALQIAWSRMLFDAGCLSDEQEAQAVEQVTAYTADLQARLQQAGYDPGEVDGIYGPQTMAAVQQLQADSGLRETGYLDAATATALDARLAELGQEAAAAAAADTAAVQTVLRTTGFWNGSIDGVWTDELTAALMAFQDALGVPPTGAVDVATLAAFQQTLAARDAIVRDGATSTTAPVTTTTPAIATTAAPRPTVPASVVATTGGPGSTGP
jgi:peptidoglycan hydrolase-like protein with peptidoglycan-binding domain